MKILLIGVFCLASVVSHADVKNNDLSKEERRARRAEVIKKRYGGIVFDRSQQRGCFLYVNAQKAYPLDYFAGEVAQISDLMKIDMRVVSVDEPITFRNAQEVQKKLKANATVYIVSNEELPPLLISPEYNYSFINVKALVEGAKDKEVMKKRISAEIWRSFAFMCSGYSTDVRTSNQEVKSVKEFDDFSGVQFGPEIMMSVPQHLRTIGIYPYVVTTYRALCHAGRAPQPTNSFQKAIWDEFHALPTKPITIEPEKRPVKK